MGFVMCPFNKKAVLVTGDAGTSDSELCAIFIEGGRQVICVENLFTGSKRNIAHLRSNV